MNRKNSIYTKKSSHSKSKFRKLVLLVSSFFVVLILAVIGFYFSVSWGFFGKIYTKEELINFKSEQASSIYSVDNVLIGKFFRVNRTNVDFDSFPTHLISALVATEDARYFEHEGVDSKSLLRVLIKSILLNDKSAGGGSTITQQLAKNMFGRKSHGMLTMPVNKCKEIILAQRIESLYSKNEILALYLNTVPFGENVYGIEAAAKRFFNVSAAKLKIEEAAVLVGMLKANNYYNPRLYPQHALVRRSVVLQQMHHNAYISKSSLDSICLIPLKLDYANLASEGISNYFLVQLKKEAQQLIEEYNEKNKTEYDLEKDGLKISSTLNYNFQKAGQQAFKQHLSRMQSLLNKQFSKKNKNDELSALTNQVFTRMGRKNDLSKKTIVFSWEGMQADSMTVRDSLRHELSLLQAGLLAIKPTDGAILSWIGGIDFLTQPYDQILAKRQLASTFKPILYAAAIEGGKMPCDYIDNSRFTLSDYDGWSPENYNQKEGGKYSVAAALANSKNIPAVRMLFETGYENVDYLWKKLGFSSELKNEPSLALGTVTASVYELAIAYASFANGGYKVNPYCIEKIETSAGVVLFERKNIQSTSSVLKEKTIHLMNGILQKAIQEGTGTAIPSKFGLRIPLAGKTGTAQSYSDAWFACYNPGFVMVSRVGANSPSIHFNNGTYGSGGSLALPLCGITLQQLARKLELKKLINVPFDELPDSFKDAFNCEDYKEDNKLNEFFNQFKKKETTLEKEQKKAKRRKRNPFKKLF